MFIRSHTKTELLVQFVFMNFTVYILSSKYLFNQQSRLNLFDVMEKCFQDKPALTGFVLPISKCIYFKLFTSFVPCSFYLKCGRRDSEHEIIWEGVIAHPRASFWYTSLMWYTQQAEIKSYNSLLLFLNAYYFVGEILKCLNHFSYFVWDILWNYNPRRWTISFLIRYYYISS